MPAGLTGAAAVAALAGAGGASGAIGYVGNWYADGAHPDQWSWTGLGLSVLGGAVLGPLGGKIGGSGGSPGMRLAVPRFELPQLLPEPALAGVPSGALAGAGVPASQGVVVGAVSAQGARAIGTAVQSGAGATGMAMSATGGGGGSEDDGTGPGSPSKRGADELLHERRHDERGRRSGGRLARSLYQFFPNKRARAEALRARVMTGQLKAALRGYLARYLASEPGEGASRTASTGS